EVALSSGTARDDRGTPNGSMGVDAADIGRTGRPSLWVANYENELHALYVNRCEGNRISFSFGKQSWGIAAIGQAYVSFGTAFLDVDNDGWEDIFVSNGHAIMFPTGNAPRAERPVLLRNLGTNKFKDITELGGPYFHSADLKECVHVGRGLTLGDLDNDGRCD